MINVVLCKCQVVRLEPVQSHHILDAGCIEMMQALRSPNVVRTALEAFQAFLPAASATVQVSKVAQYDAGAEVELVISAALVLSILDDLNQFRA
jgi:hypothetical protein